MKWGLENTWSYYETTRALDPMDPKSDKFRTFAFAEGKAEVREPMLECFERHFTLWDAFQEETAGNDAAAAERQAAFNAYKAERDEFCVGHAKKIAPRLYFDFVADSPDEYVLVQIEITTLRFSEYRGGGFFFREGWYDVLLSHEEDTKTIEVERKLVFSGHGRAELRLWSDNFYSGQGWIAPMGEYHLDIRFVFMVSGKPVSVATGPFLIDV